MHSEGDSEYRSTNTISLRKRDSNTVILTSLPNKMGKQTRVTSLLKRSAENILKDIRELREKRQDMCADTLPEAYATWRPESITCPQADVVIPQKALELFVRHLAEVGDERLPFWRKQYEDSMPEEADEVTDDCEELAMCPVCGKESPRSKIEAHADECAAKMFEN